MAMAWYHKLSVLATRLTSLSLFEYKKFLGLLGALASGARFLYGQIEWIKIRTLMAGIVDSCLRIKDTPPRVFPILYLYREAMHARAT